MNNLRQLFGSYNICARFAPGFLFVLAIYFLLGYNTENLQGNSIIFIVLLFIISGAFGFISAALAKLIEQKLWKLYGNPTILYLRKNKNKLYTKLLKKQKNDDSIMTYILKITRDDNNLLWKNISYGFFRNSILLSLVCLFFSCSTKYCCYNILICITILVMTFICVFYYAEQAIKSCQEKKCRK